MKSSRLLIVLLILTSFSVAPAHAQVGAYDPDQAFKEARTLAYAGHTAAARDTLNRILGDYPHYSDVETLLANTYSWEGEYDRARRHLNRVTSRDRRHAESWLAAIRNERNAGNRSLALGLSNKALLYLEGNPEIATLREEILSEQEERESPAELPFEDPTHRLGVESAVEVFDQVFDPMYYASAEYQYTGRGFKVLPRLNFSRRFEQDAMQAELDVYPRLTSGLYAYLNYGYSGAETYPQHRMAAELFVNRPGGLEFSAGMRYLDVRTTDVYMLTGSLAAYTGNYYFGCRPYLSLFPDRDPGLSAQVWGRRYLRNKSNYLGLSLVYGQNPETRQLRSGLILVGQTQLYVESRQIQAEYQFTGKGGNMRYRLQMGTSQQEFLQQPGAFFWAFQAGVRIQAGI